MSEAPAAESTTERASRLFHLAIFAKRNGFPDRGWSLLEKAAREPGFEWVLESCFRQDAVELVDEWKQATGGVAPAGETLPARKQPPLAGTESGEEPGGAPPDGVVDLLKHAQEQSRLGSQFLGRSLEGQDAGKLRRQAVESFQEAMASLDKVLERDPENKEARNLRREVGSLLQIASKDLGFYD
jgi:hypothetical protein